MDENNIRKYAQLMKELDLTALEITSDNEVIRMERSAAAPAAEPRHFYSSFSSPLVSRIAVYNLGTFVPMYHKSYSLL